MGFGRIEFRIRLKFGRKIALGIDGFDGTFGDARGAIDAIFGMNDHLVIQFVKASDRANFHAIREFAVHAFTCNDMCHN